MIYVDLDETLVCTKLFLTGSNFLSPDLQEEFRKNYLFPNKLKAIYEQAGEQVIGDYVTRLRPFALPFCETLLTLAPTVVLTNGITNFQKQVIKLHKIPIKEVYGRDNYHNVPPSSNGILIDNDNLTSGNMQNKLKAIGFTKRVTTHKFSQMGSFIITDRIVNVKPWFGDDFDDQELMNILPKIERLVNK